LKINLTIFILTYNRKKFLIDCLNSIKNQTYKTFKVIILDNFSEEDYINELEDLFSNSLDFIFIKHNKNIGAFNNFKFAWQFSIDTEYFMIFHDDDIMHPELISENMKKLEQDNSLIFSCSKMLSFKNELQIHEIKKSNFKKLNSIEFNNYLILSGDLHFGSIIYKASLRDKIIIENLFSKFSIIFDRPLLSQLSNYGNILILDSILVFYRMHEDQDSKTRPLNFDNLFNLHEFYNSKISQKLNILNLYIKTWFLYQLLDSNKRLPIPKRKTFFYILNKFKSIDNNYPISLFLQPFIYFYFLFLNLYSKLKNNLVKILYANHNNY